MYLYLKPKKRLRPLLAVIVVGFIAYFYILFFQTEYSGWGCSIILIILCLTLLYTSWVSHKQLDSLYLLMNNAYIRYREGVATRMISYDTFVSNFKEENKPDRSRYRILKDARYNTDSINFDFVTRLLKSHKEEVEKSFAKDYPELELPQDVFQQLCQLNKQASEGEVAEVPQSMTPSEVTSSAPTKKDSPSPSFDSRLTDKDMEELTNCINELRIMETATNQEISVDDLKAFLNCSSKPEDQSLVLLKNKEFCYLFKNMSTFRLITLHWQAPIYKYHLLVSSSQRKYVTRQNLSVSVNKTLDVPPDGAQVTDRCLSNILKRHRK